MRRMTVEDWISQALSDGEEQGKKCTALGLVLVRGGMQEEIKVKPLKPEDTPKELAAFFVARATGFAQDLPGIQTFKMLAFYGKNEPEASFPFTVSEGALTAGNEIPFARWEPTPNGLIAQTMKHLEAVMFNQNAMVQALAVSWAQDRQEHRREQAEMLAIMRDVMLSMRKESHEMRMKELEFQRSSREREMVAHALPSMVNYLTGREVIPENLADSQLISAMAMQVSPEDLQALVAMGKIDSKTATVIAARFKKARDDEKERQEAIAAAPPEENEEKK